jgi:hypothetical protein
LHRSDCSLKWGARLADRDLSRNAGLGSCQSGTRIHNFRISGYERDYCSTDVWMLQDKAQGMEDTVFTVKLNQCKSIPRFSTGKAKQLRKHLGDTLVSVNTIVQ